MKQSADAIDQYLEGRRTAWLVYGILGLVFMFLPWVTEDGRAYFVWDVLGEAPGWFVAGCVLVFLISIAMIVLSRLKISPRARAYVGFGFGCVWTLILVVATVSGVGEMRGNDALGAKVLGFNGWFPLGLLVLGCGCVMRRHNRGTVAGRVLMGLGAIAVLLFFLTPAHSMIDDVRIALLFRMFGQADQLGGMAFPLMMITFLYLILFFLTLSSFLGMATIRVEGYMRGLGAFMLNFVPCAFLVIFVIGLVYSDGDTLAFIMIYSGVFYIFMNELVADGCVAFIPRSAFQASAATADNPYGRAGTPPPPAPSTPNCPHCQKEATWIGQYQRWYCYPCEKYLEP